jgi:two-component system, chemotaxis family, sensor kinase CheA
VTDEQPQPPSEKPSPYPPPSGADEAFPFEEYMDDYYAESDEHLLSLRRGLAGLETSLQEGRPPDPAIFDRLLISFHTLKGLSGMVSYADAEHLAHDLESLLRHLRGGEAQLTSEALAVLADGVKALAQVIAAHREGTPSPNIEGVLERLYRLAPAPLRPGPPASAAGPAQAASDLSPAAAVWRFSFTPTHELAERGVNVNLVRSRLLQMGELIEAVPIVTEEGKISFQFTLLAPEDEATFAAWAEDGVTYARLPGGVTPEQQSQSPQTSAAPAGGSGSAAAGDGMPPPHSPSLAPPNFVRVDLSRLDELMNLVGELVMSRARLEDNLARVEGHLSRSHFRTLMQVNHDMERQLRYLREGIMRVRMVPIGDVFERLQFLIRDMAREHGKHVSLRVSGQETELDKLVVERIVDPLLHMVRNAVSHGLELPEEREAAGKPAAGAIELHASTSGDIVILEIADDGHGVDTAAVTAKARAQGLLADDAPPLEGEELLSALCAPGFSTRGEADLDAGRGVGMAVVRSVIRSLGGSISLSTQAGAGTRFTIRLPLTLTITDALILSQSGQRFAIPHAAVSEVIDVPLDAVTTLENNQIMPYHDGVLPLLYLSDLFGQPRTGGSGQLVAVVVGEGAGSLGVVVDRVLGQQEIVVRSMIDPLLHVPGIAGATELGDGRVVLILDATALLQIQSQPKR